MSVIALFSLDDQLLKAAQQQTRAQQSQLNQLKTPVSAKDESTGKSTSFQPFTPGKILFCTLPQHSYIASLPALYWLSKSLQDGVADSLAKLNPALVPDSAVHAYHLGLLGTEERFSKARTVSDQIQAFSLNGSLIRKGQVGQDIPLSRTLFGQFGGYCLHIYQPNCDKSMAIGLFTEPNAIYAFDASIGLFKMMSPGDLANMLTIWIESEQSLWYSAHYELWRVTL